MLLNPYFYMILSMTDRTTLMILIILLFILLNFLNSKKKHKKHKYNISQGKNILSKLNEFEYSGQKINYLRKIDPFVFEELILTAFEKKGYKIKRNKKYTGDGGIDGQVYDSKGNKILIQAKRYSNYISLQHLKDFEFLLNKRKCKGIFIHTGKTGKKTYQNFNNKNIEIYSGDKLISLLNH